MEEVLTFEHYAAEVAITALGLCDYFILVILSFLSSSFLEK